MLILVINALVIIENVLYRIILYVLLSSGLWETQSTTKASTCRPSGEKLLPGPQHHSRGPRSWKWTPSCTDPHCAQACAQHAFTQQVSGPKSAHLASPSSLALGKLCFQKHLSHFKVFPAFISHLNALHVNKRSACNAAFSFPLCWA